MNKSGQKIKLISTLVIGLVAVVLISLQFISNTTVFVRTITLKLEHPTNSSFPELENLLRAFVKDDRVDYAHAKNSSILREAMQRLEILSPNHINDPKDKLCFWINAYNLLVFKEIADRFPIKTIKQLGNDMNQRKFLIGGALYSLQDIYVKEIMPLLEGYPKASFLICNGTIGHPPLPSHALKGSSLESDSEVAAQDFISKPENVAYNTKSNTVFLSPWFLWHEPIFSKKFGSSEKLVACYLSPEKRKIFAKVATAKSFARQFDWRINNQESMKK